MSAAYEVIALRYGTVCSSRGDLYHRFGAYGEPDTRQDMDFFFYVLRGATETILVDTGFRPESAPPRGREVLIAPRDALARLGIPAATISRVILTHLHWDHIGNVERFPHAPLHVSVDELEFWSGPIARHPQFWAHVEPDGVEHVMDAWRGGRVRPTGADGFVVPGVRAITVGGHSPGQQMLVVNTAAGRVLLASDAVHFYEELELERPFGVLVDLRKMIEAYALVRALCDGGAIFVPGHDPLVAERFASLDGDGIAYRLA